MKRSHTPLLNAPKHALPQRRTVIVKVTLVDRPKNGVDDLHASKAILKAMLASGELKTQIKAAIFAVTGVAPKISGLKVKSATVEGWDVKKCSSHMSTIVKSFTIHYSRAQVPLALYNECTNFMTKISFSHDYVLDHRDAARCRIATRKFERKWKYGKKADPKDFGNMCVRFCEAKYGNDAPSCHVSHGDKLAGQPL